MFSSLAVKQDRRGAVSGKAVSESAVFEVLDALKSSRALDEVKLLYVRDTAGSSRTVTFAFSFSYSGEATVQ